jgi:hypothetical protein
MLGGAWQRFCAGHLKQGLTGRKDPAPNYRPYRSALITS